jgi:hypothetical protein
MQKLSGFIGPTRCNIRGQYESVARGKHGQALLLQFARGAAKTDFYETTARME